MKPFAFSLFRPVSTAAIVATVFAVHSQVKAQSTWNTNANGNWGTAGNWTGGVPNSAGAVANVTFNITNTRTITLDGANGTHRTIGALTIGDLTTRSNSFVIVSAASTTNSLIFDSGGAGNATLTTTTASVSDTISAPILLNSSLDINNQTTEATTARTLTLTNVSANSAGNKVVSITGAGILANARIVGNITDGAGSVSIVKNGGNILTLGGATMTASNYSGGVTMTAGTLLLNSATALGTGAFTVTGGTIGSSVATTLSTNNVQSWNSNFNFGGSTDLNLGSGAVTLSANRQIGLTGTTTAGVGPVITVGGDIGGAGAFSLTTINSGSGAGITTILNLDGTNTYTGGTNVNGGVVRFADAAAIPASGNIAVGVNGALSVSGVHTTLAGWLGNAKLLTTSTGALALTADSNEAFNPVGFNGLSLGAQVGSTVVYTGNLTASTGGYFIGGGGGSIEFSNLNALTGVNAVTIGNGGSGTTILSNSNDYSGATTIKAGTTVIPKNTGAFGGTTSGTTVNAGGSIQLQDGMTIIGEALTINATGSAATAGNITNGLASASGNNEWRGNVTALLTTGNNVRFGAVGGDLLVSGNVAISGTAAQSLVLTGDGGTGTVSGVISSTSITTPIIKNGDSTWTLSGANTFSGVVRIDDGVLVASTIGSATTAGNLGQTNSALGFGEGSTTGTLRYIGSGEVSARAISLRTTSGSGGAIIEQAGTGELEFSGNVSNAHTAVKTVTLTGSTAGTGKLSGVIGSGTNTTLNVAKSGTGSWVISNTGNLYTGATTVNAGTLTVTGNINSSTALNVTGGTFAWGANNIVTGPVNLSGGLLQTNDFSDSLGVLTLTGASQISMAGAAGSIIAFGNSASATWTAPGTLSILNWTGSLSGGGADQITFDSAGLTAAQLGKIVFVDPNGNTGTYSAMFIGNEIVPGDLIPEPSAMLLGALGGLGMVFRRRRSAVESS